MRDHIIKLVDITSGAVWFDIQLEEGIVTSDPAGATLRTEIISRIRADVHRPALASQFTIEAIRASEKEET